MKTAVDVSPPDSTPAAPESADPKTRAVQLAIEVFNDPRVKNKTPHGIASRVARRLNTEGYAPPTGTYFTGPRVLRAFLAAKTNQSKSSERR